MPGRLVSAREEMLPGKAEEAAIGPFLLEGTDGVSRSGQVTTVTGPWSSLPPPPVVFTGLPAVRELEESSRFKSPVLWLGPRVQPLGEKDGHCVLARGDPVEEGSVPVQRPGFPARNPHRLLEVIRVDQEGIVPAVPEEGLQGFFDLPPVLRAGRGY